MKKTVKLTEGELRQKVQQIVAEMATTRKAPKTALSSAAEALQSGDAETAIRLFTDMYEDYPKPDQVGMNIISDLSMWDLDVDDVEAVADAVMENLGVGPYGSFDY